MTPEETLRCHLDGEEASFLFQARCALIWDWNAFRDLTASMYLVADNARSQPTIETWIAQGFWFCDTWIRDWTSHPNFARPDQEAYDNAIELIHDLSYFLFVGESPYEDDTLEVKANG